MRSIAGAWFSPCILCQGRSIPRNRYIYTTVNCRRYTQKGFSIDDFRQMNRITFSTGKALVKRLTAFILCLILLSAQAAIPVAAAEPDGA